MSSHYRCQARSFTCFRREVGTYFMNLSESAICPRSTHLVVARKCSSISIDISVPLELVPPKICGPQAAFRDSQDLPFFAAN